MPSTNIFASEIELRNLHISVVALVGLAAATYDVEAPVRGWGRDLIGNGITVGDDYWHVAEGRVGNVTTVDLNQRINMFKGGTEVKVYRFPVEALRGVTLITKVIE